MNHQDALVSQFNSLPVFRCAIESSASSELGDETNEAPFRRVAAAGRASSEEIPED